MEYYHKPILVNKILEFMEQVEDINNSIIIDCTLGEGGHSEQFLKRWANVKIIGFERDAEVYERATKRLHKYQDRVVLINDNFKRIMFHCSEYKSKVSAILYDFGISSYHFDVSKRGFAFKNDQKLDMRLDNECNLSAYDIINNFNEEELVKIFSEYGQEPFSKRIAKMIVKQREIESIKTTHQLAEIVIRAIPNKYLNKHKKSKVHPATRVFQALRIKVNDELNAIKVSLNDSIKLLKNGGIILAISFHSLEDKIVKDRFRRWSRGCSCDNDYMLCQCANNKIVELLTKKPVVPDITEINDNPRSRSAKLRVCKKVV